MKNSPPRERRPKVGARKVRVPAGDAECVLDVGHPEEGVVNQGREAARVSTRGREAHLSCQHHGFLHSTYGAVVEGGDMVVHGCGFESQSRKKQAVGLREDLANVSPD